MPTSATGSAARGQREAGFTLVELMIVLVIFGLMSAVVVLSLPGRPGAVLADAEQFAARAKAAQDKAILDGRSMSVRVTSLGYAFDERDRGQWRPVGDGGEATGQMWREGTRALLADGQVVRIIFDPTGISDPAQLMIENDGKRVAIGFASDGGIDIAT